MNDYLNDNANGSYGSRNPYDDNPRDNTGFDRPYDALPVVDSNYSRHYEEIPPADRKFDRSYDDVVDNVTYEKPYDDKGRGIRPYDIPLDNRRIDDRDYDRSYNDRGRDNRLRDDRDYDRYDDIRDSRLRDDGDYDRPYDDRKRNERDKDYDRNSSKTKNDKTGGKPSGGFKEKLAQNKMVVIFGVLLVVLIILICCVSSYLSKSSGGSVTIYYTGFSNPYIQYKLSEGKWNSEPGEEMSSTSVTGYTHEITIDLGKSKFILACFNEKSGNTDNNNGKYYKFTSGTFCFNDGTITEMGESMSVPGGALKLSSFTITPSEDVCVGDEITIEAKASGGTPSYSYQFGCFNADGEETVLQEFDYNSSVTWTPETTGTYDFYVKVKDNDEGLLQKEINGFIVSGLGVTGIETSLDSPIEKGTKVTLTATIDNTIGADDISCEYIISNGSDSENITASSKGVADWKPDSAGNYTITCRIEDNDGHSAEYSIDFVVTESNNNNNNNNDNGDTVTIYYKGYNNPYIHYQLGYGEWTREPGVKMDSSSEVKGYSYKATIKLNGAGYIMACFTDGNGKWDSNGGGNYYFTAGTYTYKDGRIEQINNSGNNNNDDDDDESNIITIYYKGVSNAYAHYRIGDGEWTQSPGIKMESAGFFKVGYDYQITIDLGSETRVEICFNDGGDNWDSNGGSNYILEGNDTFYVKDGNIKTGIF